MEAIEALALVAGHVEEGLVLRNQYLSSENPILKDAVRHSRPKIKALLWLR